MSLSPQLRRHAGAILLGLVFAALLVSSAPAAPSGTSRLLVKFQPQASASARAAALSGVKGSDTRVIPDIGVHVVNVPGAADAALVRLKANSAVAFAEPDAILQPQETLPNDPYFPQQYALGGGAWGWYQTHTTQAWDITQGSPSVVIAILDTGLKSAGLSDFDGQVVSGWNVLNSSTNTSSQAGNHGTYVAGAAGLAAGNGVGNSGFCPGCRLMPVQVGNDSGAYLSDIATGLTWATDHGARVANMSWAGTSASSTLQSAINYAHSKGLVLTAAAGNSNCNCVTYPAAYSGVLAVGGTDNVGNKAGDSNYGSWVTLAAPEGNLTAWPTINGAPGYAPVGGTSLAAPVVAGIAGLLLSYNPALTNTQVEQALEATAAPVSFSVQYGRVDALAALQYLGAVDPQPTSAPVQTAPASIYYELNGTTSIAPLSSAPQPGQVLVRGVGGWTGSAGLALTGLQWQRCDGAGLNCIAVTSSSTYAVLSTDVGSTLKLVFSVKNGVGSTAGSALTAPVGGTVTPPSPPASTSLPTVSGTAQDGQTLGASAGSWSGSPTSYAYQWQRCDSSGAACAPLAGATTSSYAVQTADVGSTLRVTVTASNSAGSATATSTQTAAVLAAAAPPPPPPPAPAPASTQTVTFSGSLNPGNPARTFTVNVGSGLADAKLSFTKCSSLSVALSNGASANGPSVLTLDSTVAAGTYTYTVGGGRCSFTLTVTTAAP
jgi:subtilisin family serine protease